MSHLFELKYTNFPTFIDRLKKFSIKNDIKIEQEKDYHIVFKWDNTLFGLGFNVKLYALDDRQSFYWNYDFDSFIGFILVIALVLLIVFWSNLFNFFIAWVALSLILYFLENKLIVKNVTALFESLDKPEKAVETRVQVPIYAEQKKGLVCPACGASLTPYDEYCPECGLYLGPVWKKQPVTRTGLYDKRLEYHYKPRKKQS